MILDTNAVSALADGERGAAREFARAIEVAIPVIVVGEYRFGIAYSGRRHLYERWLDDMLSVCAVLGVNEETASRYAQLRGELKAARTPIPSNDVWIAALCRQHGLSIMSRDRHFDLVKGLQRFDW